MDTLFLVLRVVVALAAVFGAIWYLQRRFGRGRVAARKVVSVVSRQNVGGKAHITVVDMEGTRFLLGVTEGGISVLHTTEAPEQQVTELKVVKKPTIPAPPGSVPFGGTPFDRATGSILSPSTWSKTVKAFRQPK